MARDDRGGDRMRTFGKAALVVVAAAGLLYAAAAILVHTLLDSESLRQRIEPRMEAALNRDVELGGLELSVFPGLGVELHDLAVASPEEMDAPDVVSAGEVRLGIALLPLLRRRVRVDRATAEGVEARLVVLEDGRSNYGDFVPEGEAAPEDEEDASFSLELRDLRLERALVTYTDGETGRELEARGVSGRASLERDEGGERWSVEGRLEAEALHGRGVPGAERWDGSPAALAVAGRSGAEFEWLEVSSGSARLGPLELSVAGRVDSLGAAERRLDLRVRADALPLEDLAALARPEDADRVSGELDVDVELSGPAGAGARPHAEGEISLREGSYRDEAGDLAAENLDAEATLLGDSLVLRRLAGRLLGGPLEAEGTLDLAGEGRPWDGRVSAAPRLERRPGAAADDSLDLSGTVEVDVEAGGRLDAPSSARVRGTASPSGVAVRRPDWRGPVELPGGTVRLDGDAAAAEALPVVVDGDTLRADGRLDGLFSRLDDDDRPEVEGTIRGARLDLGALFPPDDEGPSYAELAFAHLGGRTVGGRDAAEIAAERRLSRPGPPPVRGELALQFDEVLYGEWRLSGVEGRLTLGADRLDVRDAGFGVLGGRVTGSLSMGLAPGGRQPFTLDLTAEGVEGREMLARLTPVGGLVSGTASLQFGAVGTLDTLLLPASSDLEGEGRLEVESGRVQENPVTRLAARELSLPALREPAFDRFVVPFSLLGDSLRLPASVLEADSLGIRFDGGVGLDGRLDLTAGLELPRRLLSGLSLPEGAVGDALEEFVRGADEGGAVSLGIAGTTGDPRVEVRFEPAAVGAPDDLRREGREGLEERARDLFDRVTGGGDAPDDTAPGDSVPPDSAGRR